MIFPKGRGQPPLIMGILNVTPDSFSDGGRWNDAGRALGHAAEMVELGADIIDIGAESTRPGSSPVSSEEEWSRLEPVLRDVLGLGVPVSVDTMKADVADRVLALGAEIINDVNGLRGEGMMEVCADHGAAVVICHSHGVPGTHSEVMGEGFKEEIASFLSEQCRKASDKGIVDIIVDPGVGFGKTHEQNLSIVEGCSFLGEEYPILIGLSRKRFVSAMYPGRDADEVSAMLAGKAVGSGANIIRTHDVGRTVSVLRPLRRTEG